MPCSDGGPSPHEENARLSKRLHKVEAILCGIFTQLEKTHDMIPKSGPAVRGVEIFLDKAGLDYDEMGVTKQDILSWWAMHKYEDKVRRDNERQWARRKKQNQMVTLEKLAEEMGFQLKKVK